MKLPLPKLSASIDYLYIENRGIDEPDVTNKFEIDLAQPSIITVEARQGRWRFVMWVHYTIAH